MKRIILVGSLQIVALVFLIVEIYFPSLWFGVITLSVWVICFFGWLFIMYAVLNERRIKIFKKKIEELDAEEEKYRSLLIFYRYIEEKETDLDLVKEALQHVYFLPRKICLHPEKANRKKLYDALIAYYLTLSKKKVAVGFFWDYNSNYFTWKLIALTFAIGLTGILILITCYHAIPGPDDVLYTALYFVFGALLVPFLSKFFGHFI